MRVSLQVSSFKMSVNVFSSLLAVCLAAFVQLSLAPNGQVVSAYPASVSLFSHGNKLQDKLSSEEAAEQSFQQFIHSAKPESSSTSTLIGELKPNSSELELMLLKNKIASTIQSMQEMEKVASGGKSSYSSSASGNNDGGAAECFIELTRVERVPGKCSKVNNGLPICQSDNYIAINTDCS